MFLIVLSQLCSFCAGFVDFFCLFPVIIRYFVLVLKRYTSFLLVVLSFVAFFFPCNSYKELMIFYQENC